MKNLFKRIKDFFKNRKVQNILLWILIGIIFLGCVAFSAIDGIKRIQTINDANERLEEMAERKTEIAHEIISTPPPEPVVEVIEIVEEPDITEPYEDAAVYIAKTIYGEARGCSVTEQAAVAWCILNRVDKRDTQTPEDVIKVVTAKGQFHGYSGSNPCTDEYYELAIDVIERWLREKEGETDVGRVLPKEYLYFAGRNGHNWFRAEYKSRIYWDWSLPSPYEEA